MAHWIADAVLVAVLVLAAINDLRRGLIPNWLIYPAILVGLAIWALAGLAGRLPESPAGGWPGAWAGLKLSGLGLLVGFVPMWIAWSLGGIGGGDAKLAAAIGALGRTVLTVYALFYCFLVGGLVAVVVMVRRRVVKRTLSRIWRFLWLAALPGSARPASPSDAASPRIPFGLALSLGTIWALVEQRLCHGRSVLDWLVGR